MKGRYWCWETDGKQLGRHRKEDRCIESMTETAIDEEIGVWTEEKILR